MINMFLGSVVSRHTFCTLQKAAWEQAMIADNIKSEFRACGIYPFNPTELPGDAYLPNSVYTVSYLMTNRELLGTINNDELPVPDEVIMGTSDS